MPDKRESIILRTIIDILIVLKYYSIILGAYDIQLLLIAAEPFLPISTKYQDNRQCHKFDPPS